VAGGLKEMDNHLNKIKLIISIEWTCTNCGKVNSKKRHEKPTEYELLLCRFCHTYYDFDGNIIFR